YAHSRRRSLGGGPFDSIVSGARSHTINVVSTNASHSGFPLPTAQSSSRTAMWRGVSSPDRLTGIPAAREAHCAAAPGIEAVGEMAGDRGPQPVRVLVIERSPTTGAALGGALEVEGMHVERTSSPEDAVESVRRRPPDLVVVEPLVAPRTCVEAVTRLRLATAAPVLVLSAVGPPMGGRAALVAAGVRAARAVPRQDPVMRFGDLCIDVAGRRVETPGGEVRLTRKEMDLLVVLAARAGTV